MENVVNLVTKGGHSIWLNLNKMQSYNENTGIICFTERFYELDLTSKEKMKSILTARSNVISPK